MSSQSCPIAVFMGGASSEHEVSLKSGAGVVHAMASLPYEPIPVVIGLDGQWQVDGAPPVPPIAGLAALEARGAAGVFIALHGPYGEDGRMQGLLDMVGLPYTGSGCAASALAMDKVRCKAVVAAQGIRVAGHLALDAATWAADPETVEAAVARDVGFPCVIKPSNQGSSKGIAMPQTVGEFAAALDSVLAVDSYVMVESFVRGREVTCGVLDVDPAGRLRPLPVTEIRPRTSSYFDYEAKYTPGATEEITPAPLPPDLTNEVMDMAAHVHEIVGCSGWSRSDIIIDDKGPVWIEVNTVPGLTETSLYPQAAAAVGISYAEMIGLFIEHALRGKGAAGQARV